MIRLAGQGEPGVGGGKPGDLLLEVQFKPHARLRTDGRDLLLTLPVAPWEAALGAVVRVEVPGGALDVRIPAGAQTGRQLRVRGKGLPADPPGDLLLDIRIVAPPATTPKAKELYETMAREMPFDPRKEHRVMNNDDAGFTLEELCSACALEREWLVLRVREGLIPATEVGASEWRALRMLQVGLRQDHRHALELQVGHHLAEPRASAGASPSNGSSSSSSCVPAISARASATIFCWPPESSSELARAKPRDLRHDAGRPSPGAPRRRRLRRPGRQQDVLLDREVGHQAAVLGHVADAQARRCGRRGAADRRRRS